MSKKRIKLTYKQSEKVVGGNRQYRNGAVSNNEIDIIFKNIMPSSNNCPYCGAGFCNIGEAAAHISACTQNPNITQALQDAVPNIPDAR